MSELSPHWPTLPLRAIATEMCLGKMLDKEKNRGTFHPYLGNINVRWFAFNLTDLKEMRFEDGEASRFELRAGDLIVCEGGEPGRAAVWRGQTENVKIQKALHRIRFGPEEYDPSFAMYYLYFGTISNLFASFYTGTTIKHLTGAALSQVQFPVPSMNQQRRIVAKIEELFSDLDAGVAALKRAKANLKRYRAAVLKAAVEGKLTEEWRAKHRGTEPASKLLARILTERRHKWEADQLAKFAAAGKEPPKDWRDKYVEPTSPNTMGMPKLPQEWCWVSLNQILTDSQNGFGKRQQESGIPTVVLRLADITDGQISLTDTRSVNATKEQIQKYALQHDDLLVVRVNGSNDLVGRFVWFDNAPEPIMFCDHFIQLRFVVSDLSKFIRVFGDTQQARRFVDLNKVSSAGQNTINQATLDRLPIPLPPVEEQAQIMNSVSERLSQIDHAETSIDHGLTRAASLRQSILKQAFEGKLVRQDPNDEPASVLLDRLRGSRSAGDEAVSSKSRGRTRKKSGVRNELE